MADPYPYDNSSQALYTPAVGATFFKGWDQQADTADHDLLCAEMSRLAYGGKQQVTDVLRAVGFTLKLWFGGETAAERALTLGTDGFVATNEAGLTVLAFRGTEANKPEDVLADGFAVTALRDEHDPSRGRVHRGFAAAYGAVRGAITAKLGQAGGPLLITGHSLGAGLATLAAAEHAARRPELITFGSPRVGDATFAGTLDGLTVHRFVDCCDLVTRIPPERFDQPHIDDFLTDLIPAGLSDGLIGRTAITAVAVGLSAVLRRLGIQPEYLHVGEPQYRDRAGKALATATPSAIADDQQTARAEYPPIELPSLTELMEPLRRAAAAHGDVKHVRDAIREFGHTFFKREPVPLRDLADHAPINYVSIFTGRE